MSRHVPELLERNFSHCSDPEKLRGVVKDLQTMGISLQIEVESLKEKVDSQEQSSGAPKRRIDPEEADVTDLENNSDFNHCLQPEWILAEQDYPTDSDNVLHYDGRNFRIKRVEDMQNAVFFVSKFPSRWPGVVYVYSESPAAGSRSSQTRVRITSKKGQPENLRWLKTLHLSKLPLDAKFRIMTGNIKWLFLTQTDARSLTGASDLTTDSKKPIENRVCTKIATY